MRAAYRYLAMAIATGVVLQAAAIAFGAFALLKEVDDGTQLEGEYENAGLTIHILLGDMVIPLLALALLVVGIVLRAQPAASKWAWVVFGLVAAQFLLGGFAHDLPGLGVLHGANALLILLASVRAISVFPRVSAQAT
jgi:heme A synthase